MKPIELQTIYDPAKSFYQKAFLERDKTVLRLISYGEPVAQMSADGLLVYSNPSAADGHWSKTTNRHITEFVAQYLNKDLTVRDPSLAANAFPASL